jgi:adenosine deaminase
VLLLVLRAHFQNLQSFLDAYQLGLTVLITQQDFYELAGAYLEHAAANNIKHAEIFFDVQSHVKRCVGWVFWLGVCLDRVWRST